MLYACLNYIQPSKEKELELEREDRQKRFARRKKNEKSPKKKVSKKAVVKENGQKENITKITVADEKTQTIVKENSPEKDISKEQAVKEPVPENKIIIEESPVEIIPKEVVKEIKKVFTENVSNKTLLKENARKPKIPKKRKSRKKISMALRFPLKKLTLDTIPEELDDIIEFDSENYPL
jgi:hypothetical protein